MGGLQIYSVRSSLQIFVCTIRLFVTSATEDTRYIPWIHRGCLVHTTEDDQYTTCVTKVRRLNVEPLVCTWDQGQGAPPYAAFVFNSNRLEVTLLKKSYTFLRLVGDFIAGGNGFITPTILFHSLSLFCFLLLSHRLNRRGLKIFHLSRKLCLEGTQSDFSRIHMRQELFDLEVHDNFICLCLTSIVTALLAAKVTCIAVIIYLLSLLG